MLQLPLLGQNCLVGHYDLNGNTNNQAQSAYNGVGNNITSVADHDGNTSGAYQFNGVDSNIEIPYNFDLPERTICAWFKIYNFTQPQGGVIYASDNAFINYGSTILTAKDINGVNSLRYNIGGEIVDVPIDANIWYFAAISVSDTNAIYYLNCQAIDTVPHGSMNSNDGSQSAFIGKGRFNNFHVLDGAIDEVWIYDCPLSISELELISGLQCSEDTTQSIHSDNNSNANIDYEVYPNPITNIVNFKFSTNDEYTIRILTLAGQEIHTYSDIKSSAQINVGSMSAGVYIFEITNKNGSKSVGKFVKQ